MELKKLVGKKIQQIRRQKGITQEKLAELIGIEVPSMSNIETGKYLPSAETLQKLSIVLDKSPWEFYYVDNIPEETMKQEIINTMEKNPKILSLFYKIIKSSDIF